MTFPAPTFTKKMHNNSTLRSLIANFTQIGRQMRQVKIINSITALEEVRLSLGRFSRHPLLLVPSVELSCKARYTNWKKNVENRGKSFIYARK